MQIVALAKSWRDGGICFAGKDVVTKKWIRPVTASGAIPKSITQNIHLGDIVEINITTACPNLHQQENYYFSGNVWNKVGNYNKAQLKPFLDDPPSIWDHPGNAGTDRVLPPDIQKYGISNSLLFISAPGANTYVDTFNKMHCKFAYKGVTYDLKITDEESGQKLSGNQILADPYLCISLAGIGWVNPHTGREECFKLIAGIII